MKNSLKKIAYWLIPQGFQWLFFNYLQYGFFTLRETKHEKEILKRNNELKNLHQGERCFILATGPSIKQQDLTRLKDEHCISVSNFFVHPDYLKIEPSYHCIAPYHPPITEDAWQKWMDEVESNIKNARLFFGISDKQRNEMNGRFVNRELYYLRFAGSWDWKISQNIDISKTIPGPQSVTVMALYIALYMGFKKIYLLGCDHDWLLHVNTSSHFYSENDHAMVRSGYNEWYQSDLEENLQAQITLWRQYKEIRKIANTRGNQIINATKGGLLDLFPRVEYESIII